jgi:hypothetical protein
MVAQMILQAGAMVVAVQEGGGGLVPAPAAAAVKIDGVDETIQTEEASARAGQGHTAAAKAETVAVLEARAPETLKRTASR